MHRHNDDNDARHRRGNALLRQENFAKKQFRKKVDEAVDTAIDMIEQAAQKAEEIFED